MRDGEKSTQKTVFIEVMSSTGPFILTDTQRGPCVQTGGFLKEKSKICLDHSYIEYFRLQSFSARDFSLIHVYICQLMLIQTVVLFLLILNFNNVTS